MISKVTGLEGDWALDLFYQDELHGYRVTELVASGKTPYQKYDIIRHKTFGLILFLDDIPQSAELDEFIYHEALVQPGMLLVPQRKRVAVIGGGEGATLREVLRFKDVEEAVMVDIDEEVVSACKKYLTPFHRGAFDDPRSKLVFAEGRKWLTDQPDGQFDFIVLDITDPVEEGPAAPLFTKEFFSIVKRKLSPKGAMVIQSGSNYVGATVFPKLVNTLKQVFPAVYPYSTFVPAFGDEYGFTICAEDWLPDPAKTDPTEKIEKLVSGENRFYDAITHIRMFHLPLHIRKMMEGLGPGDIFTDSKLPKI